MDKFTEARQALGNALADLARKFNVSGTIIIGHYSFTASGNGESDQKYVYEMTWKKRNYGVFGLRRKWNAWDDAITETTTIEDLQMCLSYTPVIEKFLEVESARDGIETA